MILYTEREREIVTERKRDYNSGPVWRDFEEVGEKKRMIESEYYWNTMHLCMKMYNEMHWNLLSNKAAGRQRKSK
jgi:hypothetical protein